MPEQSSLEKIHPKFANEHQCFSCGGYFLDKNKDAVQCKRCITDGRKSPIENAKDVLHKDVNVTELSKKVAELEALVERLTEDRESKEPKHTMEDIVKNRPELIHSKVSNVVKATPTGLAEAIPISSSPNSIVDKLKTEQIDQKPKVYKDKKCSKCDNDFTPGASAQKICHDCRQQLIS